LISSVFDQLFDFLSGRILLPFLDPIQQQIQQHELLKQLNIMNKELKLLRTQPATTNTSVPLQNVTNLLEAAANVLPSTSTNAASQDSSKSTKKPASANKII
jgi:hypothetical protein